MVRRGRHRVRGMRANCRDERTTSRVSFPKDKHQPLFPERHTERRDTGRVNTRAAASHDRPHGRRLHDYLFEPRPNVTYSAPGGRFGQTLETTRRRVRSSSLGMGSTVFPTAYAAFFIYIISYALITMLFTILNELILPLSFLSFRINER